MFRGGRTAVAEDSDHEFEASQAPDDQGDGDADAVAGHSSWGAAGERGAVFVDRFLERRSAGWGQLASVVATGICQLSSPPLGCSVGLVSAHQSPPPRTSAAGDFAHGLGSSHSAVDCVAPGVYQASSWAGGVRREPLLVGGGGDRRSAGRRHPSSTGAVGAAASAPYAPICRGPDPVLGPGLSAHRSPLVTAAFVSRGAWGLTAGDVIEGLEPSQLLAEGHMGCGRRPGGVNHSSS